MERSNGSTEHLYTIIYCDVMVYGYFNFSRTFCWLCSNKATNASILGVEAGTIFCNAVGQAPSMLCLTPLLYLSAAMFLSSLHQIPEEELAQCSTILPPHTSSFAQLFTSDKCMQVNLSPQSRSRAGGDSLKAGPGRSSGLIKGFSQPSLNTCSSRVLHWFHYQILLGRVRCIA